MASAVIISVLLMVILSLLKVNVLVSIVISALSAGLLAGESLTDTVGIFISNMGGNANTAMSYILLGGFAVAIGMTGITQGLVQFLRRAVQGKRALMLIVIALIASLSQNAAPVKSISHLFQY